MWTTSNGGKRQERQNAFLKHKHQSWRNDAFDEDDLRDDNFRVTKNSGEGSGSNAGKQTNLP
jgi:hypothetical protein